LLIHTSIPSGVVENISPISSTIAVNRKRKNNLDGVIKSLKTVIPGLSRYPEVVEFTGFWLPPE